MQYDVVIVGRGAAGSVLASRLAADAKTSVLLLEAGPDYPDLANLPDEIKFGHRHIARGWQENSGHEQSRFASDHLYLTSQRPQDRANWYVQMLGTDTTICAPKG